MKFVETKLPGVLLVEGERFADARGSFEVMWTQEAFTARGLDSALVQANISSNARRGTIRGMHYQAPPFEEVKIIRPIRGAVFDVAVDMRPESSTYRQWLGIELSAASGRMLCIPRGFAHGYLTLADDTQVFYSVTARYSPAHQRGFRWNDPAIGIVWPVAAPSVIDPRDATYPDLP